MGCSMRISYIGTQEQESGFLCSSHVFTSSPLVLSEEVIENGYFVTRKRPMEGVRMVWIPKCDEDLEYAPQEFMFTGNVNDPISKEHWYHDMHQGDAQIHQSGFRLNLMQTDNTNNDPNLKWRNANPDSYETAPSFYWGLHKNKTQS